jgi:outer membrane protein W
MTFSNFLRGTVSAAGLLVLGSAAMAADLPSRKDAVAPPILIDTFQPFQIRLKAAVIIPDGRTSVYDQAGYLGIPGVTLPLGLSYGAGSQLPIGAFTKNIAIEAICCLSKHKITATGYAVNGLDLGSTWVFPPTVLLQYHFTNFGAFQPYVGVGVNFTAYPWSKGGSNTVGLATALGYPTGYVGASNLKVSSSWGVAGQVGFDYMFNQNWGFNVDLKRIMMQPTATATVYSTALAGTPLAYIPVRAKVNIDPWIVSAGITYRFGGGSSAVVAKY